MIQKFTEMIILRVPGVIYKNNVQLGWSLEGYSDQTPTHGYVIIDNAIKDKASQFSQMRVRKLQSLSYVYAFNNCGLIKLTLICN